MYKVSDVARIAGISARTIRYYDEINLLCPSSITEGGYRLYTSKDLDKLQQILLYKSLGLNLYDISQTMNNENFDLEQSLKDTLQKYKDHKIQLEKIILNIEKSLLDLKGEISMDKKEKFDTIHQFERFKQEMLDENDANYGEELRQNPSTYDPEMVKYSRKKVKNMTKEEFEENEVLRKEIQHLLESHVKDTIFQADIAKIIYEKHKTWLFFYWGKYVIEVHRGVCDMYICDERFKQHYDINIEGCAEYLRKCVYFCTDEGDRKENKV